MNRIRITNAMLLFLCLLGCLLLPTSAEACSVCFSANTKTRFAFIFTTFVLSLLPLIMVGSVLYWIKRHDSAHES